MAHSLLTETHLLAELKILSEKIIGQTKVFSQADSHEIYTSKTFPKTLEPKLDLMFGNGFSQIYFGRLGFVHTLSHFNKEVLLFCKEMNDLSQIAINQFFDDDPHANHAYFLSRASSQIFHNVKETMELSDSFQNTLFHELPETPSPSSHGNRAILFFDRMAVKEIQTKFTLALDHIHYLSSWFVVDADWGDKLKGAFHHASESLFDFTALTLNEVLDQLPKVDKNYSYFGEILRSNIQKIRHSLYQFDHTQSFSSAPLLERVKTQMLESGNTFDTVNQASQKLLSYLDSQKISVHSLLDAEFHHIHEGFKSVHFFPLKEKMEDEKRVSKMNALRVSKDNAQSIDQFIEARF